MKEEKAVKLSPTENGLEFPDLVNEFDEKITEKLNRTMLRQQIRYGMISPAKVLRHNPFMVAVYAESLDCVVNFLYPGPIGKELQQKYRINQKLITVNLYLISSESGQVAENQVEIDLIEGEQSNKFWKNVSPVIVDFITDDKDSRLINYFQKFELKQKEWDRLNELNAIYLKKYPERGYRIGLLFINRYATQGFMNAYFPGRLK